MKEFKMYWSGRRLLSVLSAMIVLLSIVSCRGQESRKAGIRIEITEETTKDGTSIQIPAFVSDDEETRKNLRELEKETKNLQKLVRKEQKKGTHMEMLSYPKEEENYPQVTVVWYLSEEDTRLYDLITLCVDEREKAPITCKEALEKTGMTGVDLSLNVGRLAQESGIRGELTSTEMQGFRIDKNGDVQEIYMKLVLETAQTDAEGEEVTKTEEHFFSYFLQEEKLVRLSERGIDVP